MSGRAPRYDCGGCSRDFPSPQALAMHANDTGHPAIVPLRQDIAALAEAQNWRCCYCGNPMCELLHDPFRATKDHVVPKALNGGDVWPNLVAACRRCNQLRGTMDALAFFDLMQGEPMTRAELWPDRFGA